MRSAAFEPGVFQLVIDMPAVLFQQQMNTNFENLAGARRIHLAACQDGQGIGNMATNMATRKTQKNQKNPKAAKVASRSLSWVRRRFRPMRLAGGQTRPRRANNEEGPWPRDPWQSGKLAFNEGVSLIGRR